MNKIDLAEAIIFKPSDVIAERQINELHKLLSKGRSYRVTKRQVIQSSDDRYRPLINLVKSGYIKRYEIRDDGSLSVQAIYGPGDIFPLTLAFKSLFNMDVYEGPEIIYYEAITEAELFSLDINKLVTECRTNTTYFRDLYLEAGIRTRSNIQRLENLSLKSSYRRTAHQLAFFARQFGDLKDNTIKIKVALTHQDIADVLSLTRETVSINLHKLQQKALIKTGRYIEILDISGLESIAHHLPNYSQKPNSQLMLIK